MNEPKWPHTRQSHDGYRCYCGESIGLEYDDDTKTYSPRSQYKYWNEERREVYCCVEHSLERHTATQSQAIQQEG